MRKITPIILCLTVMQGSSALAQSTEPYEPVHETGTRKAIAIEQPSARTVMLGSDCDSSSTSKKADSSSDSAASNASNGRTIRIESKTPGKAILKGTWDVKVSRYHIHDSTGNKANELNLRNQFSETSQTFLNLDDDSFKTNSVKSSKAVTNKFWCVDSSFSEFNSYDIRSDRHLWMGIDPSYFDGLYTIYLKKKPTTTGAPHSAEIKYYLRGTRHQ